MYIVQNELSSDFLSSNKKLSSKFFVKKTSYFQLKKIRSFAFPTKNQLIQSKSSVARTE